MNLVDLIICQFSSFLLDYVKLVYSEFTMKDFWHQTQLKNSICFLISPHSANWLLTYWTFIFTRYIPTDTQHVFHKGGTESFIYNRFKANSGFDNQLASAQWQDVHIDWSNISWSFITLHAYQI